MSLVAPSESLAPSLAPGVLDSEGHTQPVDLVCVVCFGTYGRGLTCPRCGQERWPATSDDAATLVRERVEVVLEKRTGWQKGPIDTFFFVVLIMLMRNRRLYLWAFNAVQRGIARRWPRCGLGIQRRRIADMIAELGAAAELDEWTDRGSGLLTVKEEADPALLAQLAAGFDPATASMLEALDWLGAKQV